MSIKVLHLCAIDSGGAGNAAVRLHRALKLNNVDSAMLVIEKTKKDNSIYSLNSFIDNKQNSISFPDLWNRWQRICSIYPGRPENLEAFTDTYSPVDLNSLELINKADILNFHWIPGILNLKSVPDCIQSKPIVWTMHDMNPFTGGCHYSGDCKKYTDKCDVCPQLGSGISNDLAKKNWQIKQNSYQNLNITPVSPSKWLADCAKASKFFADKKIRIISNSLPLDIFKPFEKRKARVQLNLPPEANLIMFGLDCYTERKGFHYLAKALNRTDFTDTVLVTFGNFPADFKAECKYPVISLGKINNQSQLAKVYSASDVYVLPSLEDNLPNTMLEAMACGTPVLGFRAGGIIDAIEHKKNGFIAEKADTAELAEGLNWLLKGSCLSQISRNARNTACEKFSFEKQADQYCQLYHELINNRKQNLLKPVRPEKKDTLQVLINKQGKVGSGTINRPLNDSGIDTLQMQNLSWEKKFNLKNQCTAKLPKISVVTPSYNQAQYLEKCITSVIEQDYPNIEYIIIDGGSTDGSLDIIKKYQKYLAYWQSKPDKGQYDAINQGLSRATGEIMTWINSDDFFYPNAFKKVAAVFLNRPEIEWLTSRPNSLSQRTQNTGVMDYLPLWSRKKYLAGRYKEPFIQQEGTFWRKELYQKAGARISVNLSFAGDLELWARFFRHAKLYSLDDLIACYRSQPEQKAHLFMNKYIEEAEKIIDRERKHYIQSNTPELSEPPAPVTSNQLQNYLSNIQKQNSPDNYLVSAVVSVYNSEKFIKGCLDDLTSQTLYAKGQLQIVIVNTGSEQNDSKIIKEYQKDHDHIKYIEIPVRQTMYQAWNHGIKAASATFITNANTDDRRRSDALETMSAALIQNPEIDLVYSDCFISKIPNETYEQNDKNQQYRFSSFFPPAVMLHYQFGPGPMWRKNVHEKIGYFDENIKTAGDYELNFRFNLELKAMNIPVPLCLYLEHENALSFRDQTMKNESNQLYQKWRTPDLIEKLYISAGINPDTPQNKALIHLDMGIRACEYYTPWKHTQPMADIQFAFECFHRAVELDPQNIAASNNLAVILASAQMNQKALQILTKLAEITKNQTVTQNLNIVKNNLGKPLALLPSQLNLPTQQDLLAKNTQTKSITPSPKTITKNKLNITIFSGTLPLNPASTNGGTETALINNAQALAALGNKVTFAGRLTCPPGKYKNVNYITCEKWISAENTPNRNNTDILVFTTGPDLKPYNYVPPATACVTIVHHFGLQFMRSPNPSAVLNNHADAVICVSEAVRKKIISQGVNPNKIHVVHNGIDPEIFYPADVTRNPNRIIFAGAPVYAKNPETLIKAFIIANSILPDIELHFFGSASLWNQPEYIDKNQVKNLTDNIHFHDTVTPNELARQFSSSALCIIPSVIESFGMVSIEAQACGCPVLAANTGGLPETMNIGKTGFIYEPNDSPSLAKAIVHLFKNPIILKQAQSRAPQFIRSNFSWQKTASQCHEIFCRVLQNKEENKPAHSPPNRTSHKPLVSVYMVTYNTEKYIKKAVNSVLSQTFEDFELIVVDDGSTDSTETIITSYNDPRIRYIKKTHKNFASGMNRAIKEAKGKFLIGVDSDDFIGPQYLQTIVNYALKNPGYDYYYPKDFILVDADGNDIGQHWQYRDFQDNSNLPEFLFLNAFSPVPNPGSLKKLEIYKTLGLYEELNNTEDFEFLTRNALNIKFKRVNNCPPYYYRRIPSANCNKFDSRNKVTAAAMDKMLRNYQPARICPSLKVITDPQKKKFLLYKYAAAVFKAHAEHYKDRFGENFTKYVQIYQKKAKLLELMLTDTLSDKNNGTKQLHISQKI